ncbi:MAG: hypothetical protein WD272_01460 [Balneolales bacterium]
MNVDTIDTGVIKDERIILNNDEQTLALQRLACYHSSQDRACVFLTSNFEL